MLIRVEELVAALDTQGSAIRETQSQLETEIALLKKAMHGLPREGEVATKVKVPKPKSFNGARVPRIWRISFGTWSSISRLQGCLNKR